MRRLLIIFSALFLLLQHTFATTCDIRALSLGDLEYRTHDFAPKALELIEQLDNLQLDLLEITDFEHVLGLVTEVHLVAYLRDTGLEQKLTMRLMEVMLKKACECVVAVQNDAGLTRNEWLGHFTFALFRILHKETASLNKLAVEGRLDAVSILVFTYRFGPENVPCDLQEGAVNNLMQYMDQNALPSILKAYVEYVRPDVCSVSCVVLKVVADTSEEMFISFVEAYIQKLQSLEVDVHDSTFATCHLTVLLVLILMNPILDGSLEAVLEMCLACGSRFYEDIEMPALIEYAIEIASKQRAAIVPTVLNLIISDDFFQKIKSQKIGSDSKRTLSSLLLIFSLDHADAYANRQRSLNDASRRFLQEHDGSVRVKKAKMTATVAFTLAQGLNPAVLKQEVPELQHAFANIVRLLKMDLSVLVDLHTVRIIGVIHKFFDSVGPSALSAVEPEGLKFERLKSALAASSFVLEHLDLVSLGDLSLCRSHLLLAFVYTNICQDFDVADPPLNMAMLEKHSHTAGAILLAELEKKTLDLMVNEMNRIFVLFYKTDFSFACQFVVSWILADQRNALYCACIAEFLRVFELPQSIVFSRILAELTMRKCENPDEVNGASVIPVLKFCCKSRLISRTLLLICLKALNSHLSKDEIETIKSIFDEK